MKIEDFRNISPRDALFYLSSFTAILFPGILILFLFQFDLFISLDIFKLILLSIAITSPIMLVNVLINFILIDTNYKPKKKGTKLFVDFLMGAVQTCFVYYMAIAFTPSFY
jgi:hypothetical protein